jgi:predicted transcriptional regulator
MDNRKMFTNRIDDKLLKETKKLAIDLSRPLNSLIEEAIKDLLTKYRGYKILKKIKTQ